MAITSSPAPRYRNPLLQCGARIATLIDRGEAEGIITGIDESRAEAELRLTDPRHAGLFHIAPLAHLVPIDAEGLPIEETPS
ncbi:hypothetical protein [Maricaulis sp.]|uniref:hypothetical protein n=1 Tax=Maricaulis sp. TaxID=1486257 RepID=UPI003A939587